VRFVGRGCGLVGIKERQSTCHAEGKLLFSFSIISLCDCVLFPSQFKNAPAASAGSYMSMALNLWQTGFEGEQNSIR
jgi:hypothetical protein